jgi:hypothetical protein
VKLVFTTHRAKFDQNTTPIAWVATATRPWQCAPSGNLRDLTYVDLVPILNMQDEKARAELLRRVVRVAIGAETRNGVWVVYGGF